MVATILVCDDDSAIRTVLNQALGRAGYDVRTTGTAAGLWRWISAGEGNLVITDVVLPDESGFDLIPRIKRIRPELPILVMSAQNTLLTAITAAERGAFEYLPKPFDLKELTNVVARALASPLGKRDDGLTASASPGPPTGAAAASSRPRGARCFWMRLATCRWKPRRGSCVCCSRANIPPWAAAPRSGPMYASSLPPPATCA